MGALSANRHTRKRTGSYIEYPVLANAHIYAGSLVCITTAGYATPATDTAGYKFIGVAVAEANNVGGSSGAIKILVQTDSLHLFAASGLAVSDIGAIVYVSDDQTVKTAAGNGVIVGKIAAVESASLCWVDIKSALITGAAFAGSAVTITDATSIITAANADAAITEIMKGVKTTQYLIQPASITLETGGPTVVFANGAADGFTQLTNKEVALRWNNGANPTKMAARFIIPPDLDPTKDLIVHFLGAIVKAGANEADSPTITCEAYFAAAATAMLADTDCGGVSGEFLTAATNTWQEKTLTIGNADIPAVASVLTLIFNPTDGELPADDFVLAAVWLEGTRACLTS